jgi:tetratricopeptide (TPR) repeat protein
MSAFDWPSIGASMDATGHATEPGGADSLANRLGGDDAAKVVAALPAVEQAAAAGATGARLHAAIVRARRGAAPDERRAIDAVLGRRRAFAERVHGAPAMHTVNGIGTRLYGAAEPNRADGTSIATLYFTVVYLPVLPLASYLVRADAGTGLNRSWQFFAKVPLTRGHRVWRWGALAAVVLGLCAIGDHVIWRSHHSRIRVVNGLDVEVEATIGREHLRVGSGGIGSVEVPSGRNHISTRTASGEPVEELDVVAPGSTDLVAYDVLGAAPIRVAEFWYVANGAAQPGEPRVEDHFGEPFVVRDDVHFVFETPPEQIKMSGDSQMRRRALLLKGGWRSTVAALNARADRTRAGDLACRVALLERTDEAIAFAAQLVFAKDAERALQFAEQAVARAPDSIEAHRAYQSAMERLGRNEEIRPRYRTMFEKAPDSARAGYLYARTLPRKEALPLLETLVAAHPDDPWCRRAIAWCQLMSRRYAEAGSHFQKLGEIDPSAAGWTFSYRVEALVGAGKTPEAERFARAAATSGEWSAIVASARLARLPDADKTLADVTTLLPKSSRGPIDAEGLKAILAAAARDARAFDAEKAAIKDGPLREACQIDLWSLSDLDQAATAAAGASAEVVEDLEPAVRLLLACELVRTGRTPKARQSFDEGLAPYATFDALRDLGALLADENLDLETRAVVEFSAARRAQDPAERDRLLADARSDDLLRCFVPR